MAKLNEIDVLNSMVLMLQAGISPQQACKSLAERIEDPKQAAKLDLVATIMDEEGQSFVEASEQAGMFLKYTELLKVGQRTGTLTNIMADIIESEEQIRNVGKKARSAFIYPVGLIIFSIFIGFGLSYILEQIVEALDFPQLRDAVPFQVARFMTDHRMAIFGLYSIAIFSFLYILVNNAHRIPKIRDFYNAMNIGQAFRLVALGISNSLSIQHSLYFASETLRGKWREIFESMGNEASNRSVGDIVDDIAEFMRVEHYLILKSRIDSGDTSKGFDTVGKSLIDEAILRLNALSPFAQMFATVVVGVQVILLMAPIYTMIIAFVTRLTSSSGGF